MKIKIDVISEKLADYAIENLGTIHNFKINSGGKITATIFIFSFFMMISTQKHSLNQWALNVGTLINDLFSKSRINSLLCLARVEFAYAFLQKVLQKNMVDAQSLKKHPKLLEGFGNVYVEDSTCLKLPKSLASHFQGPHVKNGECATTRIQQTYEVKSETYTKMEIQSFRDNDQKYALHIIGKLKMRDLLIRDLGYFNLTVFKMVQGLGAFFLSRYMPNVIVFDSVSEEEINLFTFLKKKKEDGFQSVDIEVFIGKEAKVPVRLVALRVPDNIASERRRKAKKDRHQSANHSKEYLELLDWIIFVTNVPYDVWKPKDVLKVYGYRWRIEIIFKAWKSGFKIDNFFANVSSMTLERAKISLYLFLAWITIFLTSWFNYFFCRVLQNKNKFLSSYKFANFVMTNFNELLETKDFEVLVNKVAYYCSYEKRKDRLNFFETLDLIYLNPKIEKIYQTYETYDLLRA